MLLALFGSKLIDCLSSSQGEPGYSLYIPSEFALQIYDNLMKVGRDYGIRLALPLKSFVVTFCFAVTYSGLILF